MCEPRLQSLPSPVIEVRIDTLLGELVFEVNDPFRTLRCNSVRKGYLKLWRGIIAASLGFSPMGSLRTSPAQTQRI